MRRLSSIDKHPSLQTDAFPPGLFETLLVVIGFPYE
jgi:hypothetical protein